MKQSTFSEEQIAYSVDCLETGTNPRSLIGTALERGIEAPSRGIAVLELNP